MKNVRSILVWLLVAILNIASFTVYVCTLGFINPKTIVKFISNYYKNSNANRVVASATTVKNAYVKLGVKQVNIAIDKSETYLNNLAKQINDYADKVSK